MNLKPKINIEELQRKHQLALLNAVRAQSEYVAASAELIEAQQAIIADYRCAI